MRSHIVYTSHYTHIIKMHIFLQILSLKVIYSLSMQGQTFPGGIGGASLEGPKVISQDLNWQPSDHRRCSACCLTPRPAKFPESWCAAPTTNEIEDDPTLLKLSVGQTQSCTGVSCSSVSEAFPSQVRLKGCQSMQDLYVITVINWKWTHLWLFQDINNNTLAFKWSPLWRSDSISLVWLNTYFYTAREPSCSVPHFF